MSDLPLDPNAELFKWGPIPGRFYYMSNFVECMYPDLPAPYQGCGFTEAILLFRGGRMIWVNEFGPLWKAGKHNFTTYMLDEAKALALYKDWTDHLAVFRDKQREIDETDFAALDDAAFTAFWKDFHTKQADCWVPSIVIEMANYGSENHLTEMLRKYIHDDGELAHAVQVLASPETLSFYQAEEIALEETADLEVHAREYSWLNNSYSHVEPQPVSFFAERKQKLAPGRRADFERHISELRDEKNQLQAKYGLPEEVMRVAHSLWRSLMWQDERKREIFRLLSYKKAFLAEAGRRTGIPLEALENLGEGEAVSLLISPEPRELAERRASGEFGFHFSHAGAEELDTPTLQRYWEVYAEPKHAGDLNEFKGVLVSKGSGGKVTGKVRIVLDAHKMGGFDEGDILVAPMTSPEYIFAMKLAGAIVTDTGGMTSHAAVVSRELGKVCVVNTKVATSILKDGDMVEVDAEKGVVRKLTDDAIRTS